MPELKHPYPSIYSDGTASYGGNQRWSNNASVQSCGCGIVAAVDLLMYLNKYHNKDKSELFGVIEEKEEYSELLNKSSRTYFPVIPPFGMTGITLVSGISILLRKHRIPLKARLAVSDKLLWPRVKEMIENDFPVILAIGQNFPFVWHKNKLNLYSKTEDGLYKKHSMTKAHYVTVTAMDNDWLKVSSWGKMLYINRSEFDSYVKRYSLSAISNIIYIEKR